MALIWAIRKPKKHLWVSGRLDRGQGHYIQTAVHIGNLGTQFELLLPSLPRGYDGAEIS